MARQVVALEQRKKLMNVGHRPPLLLDHSGIGSRF
ncbi:hypothetical protein EC990672_4686A, partial [Escherichia coli 99.0672]